MSLMTITVDTDGRVSVSGSGGKALGAILARKDLQHIAHVEQSAAMSVNVQLYRCMEKEIRDGASDDEIVAHAVAALVAAVGYYEDPAGFRDSMKHYRAHMAAPRN